MSSRVNRNPDTPLNGSSITGLWFFGSCKKDGPCSV